jgi:hypothetical protein
VAAHYRSEQAQVHGVRRPGYRITVNICAFGWKARDFALKGVDCKTYSLAATEKATETLSLFLRMLSNGHGDRSESASPFRSRDMADTLITDQEVALLCDVLEGWGANLNADKRKVLDQLIAKGFVVAADQESPAKYKLTGKAQRLLAERGVGLSGG